MSASNTSPEPSHDTDKHKACDQLENALAGNLAKTVSAHERMILQYYQDVQQQATQSFEAAKMVAWVGFGVLIVTLVYVLVFDALAHLNMLQDTSVPKNLLTVGGIGVVSGVLIEFIAGVNFWLYGRASKQFGAFHICLERTHRYLIAYKICEEMTDKKDETLQKIVCIMANAPMITAQEIRRVADVPEKIEKAQAV
jgi:hypothetical protein